ncbi:hypothetical protein [Deinococcus sp. QL22]|uniref:hypothetical protein n=1 Tax=Deinococcus sp. QL22 TaxID=2939437 RepID=UPI00201806A7|nr:hypothetical protein [Deinococcus sp. QL22]UQN08758.1 hypothetical protein M1R55_21825 [Deinococcus sp. QL22]
MKRILSTIFLLASYASAQVPNFNIQITPAPPPPQVAVAQKILVQPQRIESRLNSGYTTGGLTFTLFSEIATEVRITSSDPRLVFRYTNNKVILPAYVLQNINAVVLEAHSGHITVTNSEERVLAVVPYTVEPAKKFSQGAYINYSPLANTAGLTYSIGSAGTSPLQPNWSLNVGIGVGLTSPSIDSANIGVSVRW